MSDLSSPLQQTVQLIQRSNTILLLTHARPDGDGLSAILALRTTIERLGKKAVVAAADAAPFALRFLPGVESVAQSVSGTSDLILSLPVGDRTGTTVNHVIEDGRLKISIQASQPFNRDDVTYDTSAAAYDLIIVCDTPELPMLGRLFEMNPDLYYETPVVNIDHHVSNTAYGRVNFIDYTAASSTELATRVIRALESETNTRLIDEDVATLLLTGIITDTGSFQHSNTTPRSFEIAASLIEAGARQQEIIHHVYKTKQLTTLKLWGRVLSKIQADPVHRLVWSTITTDDLADCGATDEEAGGIIDELMTNAPGAEVVLLLKQNHVGVTASLRTTTPAVSASEIAHIWGGGGHIQAAGFKIAGKQVEDVERDVIKAIRKYQAERLGIVTDEDDAQTANPTPSSTLASPLDEIAESIAGKSE